MDALAIVMSRDTRCWLITNKGNVSRFIVQIRVEQPVPTYTPTPKPTRVPVDITNLPANYTWKINPVIGNAYGLSHYTESWLGAYERAISLGGYLAAVGDPDENQWILKMFGKSKPVRRMKSGLEV